MTSSWCVQAVMQSCAADSGTISCSLYTNIYNRAVTRGAAVHPLATGINTTSLTGTRDWLLSNILQATDEYSYALSANMTSLVRKNFDINDRVNKAWFVNPGNRWNIPMTNGYQSDLLLSDRLLVVAMITLNDGAGNIMRRRLLSFSPSATSSSGQSSMSLLHETTEEQDSMVGSTGKRNLLQVSPVNQPLEEYIHVPLKAPQIEPDDASVEDALAKIMQEPRTGTLPAVEYNVDIASSVMKLYSADEEPSTVLEFIVYGKFSQRISLSNALKQIGEEFYRRMNTHMNKYCPECKRVVPVFNNLQKYGVVQQDGSTVASGAGRRLLQANNVSGVVYGTYSVLLVYDKASMDKNLTISLSDIQRAVDKPNEYTVAWTGYTSRDEMIKLISDLREDQFVIGDLQTLDPVTKRAE